MAATLEDELAQRRGVWERVLVMDDDEIDRQRLRRTAAPGAVRLTLGFDASWRDATRPLRIDLAQDAKGEGGYRFVLEPYVRVPDGVEVDDVPRRPAVRELAEHGGMLRLRFERAGQPLRSVPIDPLALDEEPLQVHLERSADRLSVQLNDLDAFVVHDSFPVRGEAQAYADVDAPSPYELRSVRLARQHQPATPSPLEEGDALFAADRIDAALAFYREQSITRGDDAIGREAQYKFGLCELLLGRHDAAAETFASLLVREDDRWSALAGMRLWLLHLDQGRHAEAQTVLDALTATFSLDRIATHLTDDLFESLTDALRVDTYRISVLLPGEPQATHFAQLERMQRALGLAHEAIDTQYRLARTYEVQGEHEQALAMFDRLLAGESTKGHFATSRRAPRMIEIYAVLMHQADRADEALAQVEGLLEDERFQHNPALVHLRVERARLLDALNRREEAIAALHEYLDKTIGGSTWDRAHARLLLGWLVHDDSPGEAERIWGEAYDELVACRWWERSGSRATMTGVVLGSLTGRLERPHVEAVLEVLANSGADPDDPAGAAPEQIRDSLLRAAVSLMRGQLVELFHELCHGERGRRLARIEAFRKMPFDDRLDEFGRLVLYRATIRECFEQEVSEAEDGVVWALAGDLWHMYRQGRFDKRHMTAGFWTFQGWRREMGWDWLVKQLPGATAARMTYVMGMRHLRLVRPSDASRYFAEVVALAPRELTMLTNLARERRRAIIDRSSDEPLDNHVE